MACRRSALEPRRGQARLNPLVRTACRAGSCGDGTRVVGVVGVDDGLDELLA